MLETDAADLVSEAYRRLTLPAPRNAAYFGAGRKPNTSLRYDGGPRRMEYRAVAFPEASAPS